MQLPRRGKGRLKRLRRDEIAQMRPLRGDYGRAQITRAWIVPIRPLQGGYARRHGSYRFRTSAWKKRTLNHPSFFSLLPHILTRVGYQRTEAESRREEYMLPYTRGLPSIWPQSWPDVITLPYARRLPQRQSVSGVISMHAPLHAWVAGSALVEHDVVDARSLTRMGCQLAKRVEKRRAIPKLCNTAQSRGTCAQTGRGKARTSFP